jgi:hypothetical protein
MTLSGPSPGHGLSQVPTGSSIDFVPSAGALAGKNTVLSDTLAALGLLNPTLAGCRDGVL